MKMRAFLGFPNYAQTWISLTCTLTAATLIYNKLHPELE